jgi:Ca2+-binding EF-hand superfamily protein
VRFAVAEVQADAEKLGAFHQDPTIALNHAEKLLADKLWGKFTAVQRAFRSFDIDKSGDLSYDEFRSALRSLGVNLSEPDFRELVAKYDTNGDGVISYDEFNSKVGNLIHPTTINTSKLHQTMMKHAGAQENALHFNKDAKLGLAAVHKTTDLSTQASDIAEKLGLKISETLLAQQLCGQYKELARRFREADVNGSGELDIEEFKALAYSMGVHMSDAHVTELLHKYDASGNNSISYDELTAKLGFLLQGSEVARQALGVPLAGADILKPPPRSHSQAMATKKVGKPDIEWDAMSYDVDDSASIASVSTSAIDVLGVESRMRKVLGRSWIKAYKNLRTQSSQGAMTSDSFRDAMAKQGVALTSKEIRALQKQHGAAKHEAVPYDQVMRATFSRSHK